MINRKKVLIIGGEGHGSVIASLINDNIKHDPNYEYEVGGFINDYVDNVGGYKVMGKTTDIPQLAEQGFYFIWAIHLIGKNLQTIEAYERINVPLDRMISVVHHSACIGDDVVLEPGCSVMCNSYIGARVHLGAGTMVKANVCIGHDTKCGKCCQFAIGAIVSSYINIGDCCNIAIGATVIEKRTIGNCSMVGAASLVTKDIPERTVWYGSPAKMQGVIKREGIKKIDNGTK